ncbi:Pentatricopeptide repeat-containing protein [Apostasia shenzhenica]|uniref:Pentatricopeptide repeat-containing protein n=1 Tax=Apostasia shenzhenica TaxID=1088818 RepID=A0A2I0B7E0_9ASPA|nr:Pentatricopeptide repeat-containing protein [Apostasia shenzhenica]
MTINSLTPERRQKLARTALQWRRSTISTSSSSFLHQQKNPMHSCTGEAADNGLRLFLAGHPNPEISSFYSKGFSEISDPVAGRALHCITLRHSLHPSIFHTNTLINFYFRFGRPSQALQLFDQMTLRNNASWNTVISGLVRSGSSSKAAELFSRMMEEGGKPNGFVLASLVTACNRDEEMFYRGTQIHGLVLKIGLMNNVYVGTALLHFYGINGLLSDARKFFHEIPDRNVVTWTALMVSFSANELPEEAIRAYRQMRKEGVVCNENSYATLVSSCSLLESEILNRQVLAHVVVSGFESKVSVANSLMTLFGNMGKTEDAERLFHRMKERDSISWNSLISVFSRERMAEEALRCFSVMRHGNFKPDVTTFSCLISACYGVDYLKWGKGFHGFTVKNGLELSVPVSNTLISIYFMSGNSEDAETMFVGMPVKDVISWNTLISSYSQTGNSIGALKLFSDMIQLKKECNNVTFSSAFAACANLEDLHNGKVIHALSILIGLGENLLVGNSLITMYSKCNAMREAELVFRGIPYCDVVTWNALIGGYMENEEKNEVIRALNHMKEAGVTGNYITFVNALGICCNPYDLLNQGMPLHAHIIFTGLENDDFVKNSLITMYAKCGDFVSSGSIFEKMIIKSLVSWNAMVASKAHYGHGEEAMRLFKDILSSGKELDQFSLSAGVSASASLASSEEGRQLHSLIIKLGFDSDLHVVNATMDMYGKCGKLDDALKLVPKPSDCSRQSWNILISCYARHGCFVEAENIFKEMLLLGPKPDYVTFVSLLSACNHAGIVDKGLLYYKLMTTKFRISARIEHCVCIVDLLGRSGRLTEAEKFIEEMPVTPNSVIWRSLLSASKIHRNIDIGKKAAYQLLQLNPLDDSAYVLLSNTYALKGSWEDAENLRENMKSINLKKKPACSWIKVKNKVNTFGISDRTHPQAKEIYAKLEWILHFVKKVGYVADISQSLHNIDEEQQEHNLWRHSEKLALAFGLISVPEGCTITVFKNLRVCGDCHRVYKLVSKFVNREIVLRDPYRFHHFRGGICSCSDYW